MILIVDDFQDGAQALCRLFGGMGYPCEWKPSGPEALAFLRGQPPGSPVLLLLDYMMPEMTGIQVLREIRADAAISHAIVIMFSAGFDLEARNEAITLGAAAWLLKGGTGTGGIDEVINKVSHLYEKIGGVKKEVGG